jgi:ATPase subunit of ABC transporter with duplicated ATPase domains
MSAHNQWQEDQQQGNQRQEDQRHGIQRTAGKSTAGESTAGKSTARKQTAEKQTAEKSAAEKSTPRKPTAEKSTAGKSMAGKSAQWTRVCNMHVCRNVLICEFAEDLHIRCMKIAFVRTSFKLRHRCESCITLPRISYLRFPMTCNNLAAF